MPASPWIRTSCFNLYHSRHFSCSQYPFCFMSTLPPTLHPASSPCSRLLAYCDPSVVSRTLGVLYSTHIGAGVCISVYLLHRTVLSHDNIPFSGLQLTSVCTSERGKVLANAVSALLCCLWSFVAPCLGSSMRYRTDTGKNMVRPIELQVRRSTVSSSLR